MTYDEEVKIYERAKRIVQSDLDWEVKFDLIFSDDISNNFNFDCYIPDTSYEEDVVYYMLGLDQYMNDRKIIHEQIK